MWKIIVSIGVVCVGLCFAAVVISVVGISSAGPVSDARSPGAGRGGVRLSGDTQHAEVVRLSNDEEERLARNLPVGKGLQKLLDALNEGSASSLQVIRSDFVESVKDYEKVVMPSLREQALENLLARFTERDWKEWPLLAAPRPETQTEARQYTEDVLTVNRELGVFLDTAGQLLHGLYLSTRYGTVYEPAEGVKRLLNSANEIYASRTNSNSPARSFVDQPIIVDPAFRRVFERERGRLVARYIHQHPQDFLAAIGLVGSLDARYCQPDVSLVVADVLRRLATEGSVKLREQFLITPQTATMLSEFGRSDDRVAVATANFYAVAAVDALENHDLAAVKRFLRLSRHFKDGLKSQEYLEDYLAKKGVETADDSTPTLTAPLAAATPAVERVSIRESFASESDRPIEAAGGWSWWWIGAMVLGIGSVGLVLSIMLLKHKETINLAEINALGVPGLADELGPWKPAANDMIAPVSDSHSLNPFAQKKLGNLNDT